MLRLEDLQGLRGGVYARKSSYSGKTRNKGRSVREQLDVCQDAADGFGVRIVEKCIDDDRSASRYRKREREEFERLIELIEGKQLDIVFAWAATRLQRDLSVYSRLRDACAANGVLWWYGGRVYDLTDDDDRFRTGLDALIGEREVGELRRTVKRTLRANAVAGRPHGPTPYGYRRVYDSLTGAFVRVEVDPEQAKIVGEICTRVAAGQSYREIAADLNKRQVPSPAVRWTKGAVTRLAGRKRNNLAHERLRQEVRERLDRGETPLDIARDFQARDVPLIASPWLPLVIKDFASDVRYLGARTHHGDVTKEEAWPRIVKKSTYLHCQAVIKARQVRPTNSRPGKAKYWLTYIMVCDVCESPIEYMNHGKGQIRYGCRAPGRDGKKGYHASAPIGPVDEYVRGELFAWLSSPAFIEAFTRGDEEVTREIQEAEAEVKLLGERLEGFYKRAAKGKLSQRGIEAIEAELQPQIDEAKERAQSLRTPSVVRDLVGAKPGEVTAAWEKLSVAQRRLIAESLLRVRLRPQGRGRRNRPPEEYVTVEPRRVFTPAV
jgi:site-specific DNA recombinase